MNDLATDERIDFRLKEILDEKGLNYREAKDLTGVSESVQCDLVKRRRKLPHPKTLVALCDGLDLTPGDLIQIRPKRSK